MLDIETLGTVPGSVVLSIGACELNGPWEFYGVIDVFDSLMHGLNVQLETIDWWRRQSMKAKLDIRYGSGKPLEVVLKAFSERLNPDSIIWAKGPDFDLVLLEAAYRAVGFKKPWSYRNARDVRTILALAPQVTAENPHNALDDVKIQAQQVIEAFKALGKELS